MFSKKQYINIFSLAVLSIITFLNINRLTSNIYNSSLLISLIYVIFFLLLIIFIDKRSFNEIIKGFLPVLISIYALLPYLLITYATSNISSQSRWAEISLITYIVIIISSIILLNKYSTSEKFDSYFFSFGILYGFLFAISKEAGFLLIINILFFYRNSIPKILLFSFITLLVGLLMPNIFSLFGFNFYRELFFPKISGMFQTFIIILSIYTGWIVSDIQETFFGSGIILFLYLIFSIISGGYEWKFYIGDDTFPSFFIAVIPFLLLSIKKYKVEKFTGKVLT